MQASIIYHSVSGTTCRCADFILAGMAKVPGVRGRCMSLDEVDGEYVRESSLLILGSPVYFASTSAVVKGWLEQAPQYGLVGKIGGAFATANYIHGGGEIAIQSILEHFLVMGMLAYSGGGGLGKPVIHFGPVAIKESVDSFRELFEIYGQRMASRALELFPAGQ